MDHTQAAKRIGLRRADLLRTHAYVAGVWLDANDRIIVRNPATGEALTSVPDLGAREAQSAIAAAELAGFAWRAHSAKERALILRRWFELLLAHKEDLARLMTAEQGKPLAEARAEIAYAASFIEWFAEETKRSYGDLIPAPTRNTRIWVDKRPIGVVAAITPWNFPAAMITRKVAPALAAGCTVVLKPSDLTPLSALALAALGEEAGLHPGVFSVITGAAGPIGDTLVSDPRVGKFTFTGSTAVGKMLAARCMTSVKRLSLELGGNAPFIVCADANIETAVAGALASKFRNTGQTCVCANRFYVHARVYDRFIEDLAERTAKFRVGDGLGGETEQGPLIDTRAIEKVRAHVADALGRGAQALIGGRDHSAGACFYQPTVLANVDPGSLLCHEETFGPVAGVVRVDDEADAVRLANASRAGLAS